MYCVSLVKSLWNSFFLYISFDLITKKCFFCNRSAITWSKKFMRLMLFIFFICSSLLRTWSSSRQTNTTICTEKTSTSQLRSSGGVGSLLKVCICKCVSQTIDSLDMFDRFMSYFTFFFSKHLSPQLDSGCGAPLAQGICWVAAIWEEF